VDNVTDLEEYRVTRSADYQAGFKAGVESVAVHSASPALALYVGAAFGLTIGVLVMVLFAI
jgi:hypothetical protein